MIGANITIYLYYEKDGKVFAETRYPKLMIRASTEEEAIATIKQLVHGNFYEHIGSMQILGEIELKIEWQIIRGVRKEPSFCEKLLNFMMLKTAEFILPE